MSRFHLSITGTTPYTEAEEAAADLELAKNLARQTELVKTEYQRQRAAEYPPAGEYLDGIVKGDQVQIQAYIDACLAVKVKYPKP